jgi:26S proteasome regulatory subunit N5
VPDSFNLLNERGLAEAINFLLLFEKKCRIHNDFPNLKNVCLQMIKMCHEKQDWEKLNSTLTVISKRRGQSKVAIQAIVDEAIKYLDTTPNEATKVALLTTLKDICEGQKPLQ